MKGKPTTNSRLMHMGPVLNGPLEWAVLKGLALGGFSR